MANLSIQALWSAITQIERSDKIDAGTNGDGIANLQAKQLGNRTQWLKEGLEELLAGMAAHMNAENPHAQYALLNTPQMLITEDTELGAAHNGKLLFVVVGEALQHRLTVADELPDGWSCLIVQADAGRVRIDAGSNPLYLGGNNTLTEAGSAATLSKLNSGFEINDFWLSGACTEHRQDLQLPDGSPLHIDETETLEY